MTQNKQILEYTKTNWITDIEALTKFGCRRLAARINDLDGMGYTFQEVVGTAVKQAHKAVQVI